MLIKNYPRKSIDGIYHHPPLCECWFCGDSDLEFVEPRISDKEIDEHWGAYREALSSLERQFHNTVNDKRASYIASKILFLHRKHLEFVTEVSKDVGPSQEP